MRALLFSRRTGYVLASLLTAAFVFHPFLLPLVAFPLIRADQPVDDAQFLLFLRSAKGSETAYTYTAEFMRGRPDRRVLVMHDYVRRAEAMGAEPSFVDTTIAMLAEQGIPKDRIDVIGDGSAITSDEVMRGAAAWLAAKPPSTQLIVVTHRFATGYLVDVSKTSVDSQLRQRLHIIGFNKHNVDESNWWKGAPGLKLLIREQLRLIHLWVFGERRPKMDWDPDAYEQALLARNDDV